MINLSKSLRFSDSKELYSVFVRLVQPLSGLNTLGDREMDLLCHIYKFDYILSDECIKSFREEYNINSPRLKALVSALKTKGYILGEEKLSIIHPLRLSDSSVSLSISLVNETLSTT